MQEGNGESVVSGSELVKRSKEGESQPEQFEHDEG
jgi:hypothetical protein